MPRKLDPAIADILKQHGFGPDACWDCHGTWVVYHRVLEQIAARAGIIFDMPKVLEADGAEKCVALCVSGKFLDGATSEWSIGEAAPGNNKNNYPYAMAEKRAKDRVVLKLIGLHGLVYSEDEMDDAKRPQDDMTSRFKAETLKKIEATTDPRTLSDWWNSETQKTARRNIGISQEDTDQLKNAVMDRMAALKGKVAA
jgi:hypothetical protein